MTLIIAVAGRKGGVGKSSTAVGLASISASQGLSTRIIDLDTQGNAGTYLGVMPDHPGVAQLLAGEEVEPVTCPHEQLITVLVGGPGVHDAAVAAVAPDVLQGVIDFLAPDVCLIDCPPGRPAVEALATTIADVLLFVSDPHTAGLGGAQRVIEDVARSGSKARSALVLQRYDARYAMHKNVLVQASTLFPGLAIHRVSADGLLLTATGIGRPFTAWCKEARKKGAALADLTAIWTWIMAGHDAPSVTTSTTAQKAR
jgi:chromosome partitioning protein